MSLEVFIRLTSDCPYEDWLTPVQRYSDGWVSHKMAGRPTAFDCRSRGMLVLPADLLIQAQQADVLFVFAA